MSGAEQQLFGMNDGYAKDRGPWIQTFTGRRFHYNDIRLDDIHIVDIAHALGMACRFGGHCERFYSVAEHSVLVSQQFSDPRDRLVALMHDATEAYVLDMPRPLKQLLPAYKEYELKVWSAIAVKFGLPETLPPEIHAVDARMLITERAQLFQVPIRWKKYDDVQPLPGVRVRNLDPWQAKREFMEEFNVIQAVIQGVL